MTNVEITVLISVLGLVASIATFFFGRLTAAKNQGEQSGIIITEVRQVAKDVRDIKEDLADLRQEQGELRDRITKLETIVEIYHREGSEK